MAVVCAIVLAVTVPLALHLRHSTRSQALAHAEHVATVVTATLRAAGSPDSVQLGEDDRVIVRPLQGRAVAMQGRASTEDVRRVVDSRTSAVAEVPGGLVYLEPVEFDQENVAVVEVFVPDAELSRGVATAWWALAGAGIALIVATVVVNDRLAARTVAAARRLTSAANAVGDGDLEVWVPVEGHRELAQAIVAFNTMTDRISARLTAERELIADHSHRLRTPLTALRLEAERVLASGLHAPRLAQAVEAMEREVDRVIHTARRTAESGSPRQEEQCDATEVVRERMAFWSAVAEDQSRPFSVFGTALRAPVPLPRSELAAAIDALLGNVFRYTPQGTPFEVAVSRHDGYVAIRVDDAGPGIPDPKSAMRRGASDRGSTGLGLDIVRAAAEAGGGAVHIDRSALGGASVVVLLADAQAPPPTPRPRFGFVGRLSREPDERRWRRRARAARRAHAARASGGLAHEARRQSSAFLSSLLSLAKRLSAGARHR